ncbi:isoaspartyl peptidase/L-asparaginase family protein [Bremerella alba]|uniref:Isoaspartyl peptidase n=1 Tax=Bremerella alba TaxID=980252 RepID=A0A7V8V2P8_9BACT|nr:isoaspartyl peptidase/L-asparaginase [Bremerella alba]MBA2113544.1 Isoaspartyl peptidase [Bremerella alba]
MHWSHSIFCFSLLVCGTLQAEKPRWAIALHGGAGTVSKEISQERLQKYKGALEKALHEGESILESGGSALDAVERTVMVLENASCFNAGKGAVFNAEGFHQMDASIMDGQDLSCGAVSAVERIRNPIQAARLVMEKTPHVLLTSKGAEEFAKAQSVAFVSPDYFYDATRWKQLQRKLRKSGRPAIEAPSYPLPATVSQIGDPSDMAISRGTVGCVALDQHGNLAAATSTGGMTGKMVGRVGDAPIIGAGTYADNKGCAISATGSGEEYIRNAIAAQVNWRMRYANQSLSEATQACINDVLKPGEGGVIAIDGHGNISLEYNTGSMSRAWADSTGSRGTAIWEDKFGE